jgi:hypothetical protein
MALRLAGESYTPVNGLDSMGNLRLGPATACTSTMTAH